MPLLFYHEYSRMPATVTVQVVTVTPASSRSVNVTSVKEAIGKVFPVGDCTTFTACPGKFVRDGTGTSKTAKSALVKAKYAFAGQSVSRGLNPVKEKVKKKTGQVKMKLESMTSQTNSEEWNSVEFWLSRSSLKIVGFGSERFLTSACFTTCCKAIF